MRAPDRRQPAGAAAGNAFLQQAERRLPEGLAPADQSRAAAHDRKLGFGVLFQDTDRSEMLREPVNQHVRKRAAGNQHDDARLIAGIPLAHLLIPSAGPPPRAAAWLRARGKFWANFLAPASPTQVWVSTVSMAKRGAETLQTQPKKVPTAQALDRTSARGHRRGERRRLTSATA